ncbi:hypothetical protein PIB30_034514 [Stylosanthes scabra]|uniref:Uncharacterized protein n=1 Tax=Stylosanthes scabra TaxID=79078 RepID=A0ABU6Z9N1_9FABA|nr:hypothetical protein [Stylosanthes scabra]
MASTPATHQSKRPGASRVMKSKEVQPSKQQNEGAIASRTRSHSKIGNNQTSHIEDKVEAHVNCSSGKQSQPSRYQKERSNNALGKKGEVRTTSTNKAPSTNMSIKGSNDSAKRSGEGKALSTNTSIKGSNDSAKRSGEGNNSSYCTKLPSKPSNAPQGTKKVKDYNDAKRKRDPENQHAKTEKINQNSKCQNVKSDTTNQNSKYQKHTTSENKNLKNQKPMKMDLSSAKTSQNSGNQKTTKIKLSATKDSNTMKPVKMEPSAAKTNQNSKNQKTTKIKLSATKESNTMKPSLNARNNEKKTEPSLGQSDLVKEDTLPYIKWNEFDTATRWNCMLCEEDLSYLPDKDLDEDEYSDDDDDEYETGLQQSLLPEVSVLPCPSRSSVIHPALYVLAYCTDFLHLHSKNIY